MSLDIHLTEVKECEVFWQNITHNLTDMAEAAGIYYHIWRPSEIGITEAGQLVQPLRDAIKLMKSDPERFKQFDAPNGWGTYEHFVPWVEKYLEACEANPKAKIYVSR